MANRVVFLFVILYFLASCTVPEKRSSAEAFFVELREQLRDSGFLTQSADTAIAYLESYIPAMKTWEKQEIRQHVVACMSDRYSREEQKNNIERTLIYKAHLKKYYLDRKDSLQRLYLKEIYLRLCNQNFWDSAFVEDCFWGNSDYMVVLLPQVHEVNNTEEELKIVEPVQRNISSIQKKLFGEGANAFLYEGIPFKEISRSIPTKIPLDTIAKYFSKKSEINFETNYPQVLSYGIEEKKIHQDADSIRSYYWALETFYEKHEALFPVDHKLFRQSLVSHVDSCLLVNDMNLRRLKKEYFEELVLSQFDCSDHISDSHFLQIKDTIFHQLLEVMLNERNKAFVNNTEKLQCLTGERFLVMKAGTSHFDEVDRLKDYNDFDLLTVQEILQRRKISYIYLVPYYVYHYNL